jgi:sulfur relay (sulfurtransferase) DsrC/TusE family protein
VQKLFTEFNASPEVQNVIRAIAQAKGPAKGK